MNSQALSMQLGIALVAIALAYLLAKYTGVNAELQKVPKVGRMTAFTALIILAFYFRMNVPVSGLAILGASMISFSYVKL